MSSIFFTDAAIVITMDPGRSILEIAALRIRAGRISAIGGDLRAPSRARRSSVAPAIC